MSDNTGGNSISVTDAFNLTIKLFKEEKAVNKTLNKLLDKAIMNLNWYGKYNTNCVGQLAREVVSEINLERQALEKIK